MTILKNKYTQFILVGFIFALISGSFGFLSYKKFMDSSKLEKIIVIIEVKTNSSLLFEISKLTSNQKISQQIRTITEELYRSINYSLIRYQRDTRLSSECFNIDSPVVHISKHWACRKHIKKCQFLLAVKLLFLQRSPCNGKGKWPIRIGHWCRLH